ncbi:MAG: heat-inducible transcription repressor HrcA [Actinobacteria bacterium]|nr:heat-inducible transcription repressor HrcA [Actinomycetota bacterium]
MKLTDRKKVILREVIVRFIKSAGPISSQNISENTGLGLSSATIRKEMAELEELGYLTHPHTSAGRIPSDQGYRFFVDNCIQEDVSIISGKKQRLLPRISIGVDKDMEMETILRKSSEHLAKLTNYLSMIVAPAIFYSKFRHIELLELAAGQLMLVLITDTGRVFKRNFLTDGVYNSIDTQSISNILNMQLKGKNISEIDFRNLKIAEGDSYLIPVIKKIIEAIRSCLEETLLYNRIFIYGASSILNQPDFIDIKKIHRIMSIIENEYLLANLLLNFSKNEEFIIKIGAEIFEEGPDDLSLVASRYKIYEQASGTIGVLGPKRMDYPKVVSIINAFVENLREIFS